MKKSKIQKILLLSCLPLALSSMQAQETKKDTLKITDPKVGGTSNVMLNASADNGPRVVNIGLPASVGGTTILENGLPVTYDYTGMMATSVWRKDVGINTFDVLDVPTTAIFACDVGVSVSSWTNRGTDTFRGALEMTTNSFGLMRADFGVSGPLTKGLYYSLTGFLNYDPGTFRSNISRFMDQTQILKAVLNKRYTNGQIGIQYKYANSEAITLKNSPYIYHKDGKVTALPGFEIGKDAYLEQSGKVNAIDPLTGKHVEWDAMKDAGATSHVVDLMGDHTFDNKMIFDYTARFQTSNAGQYNPYITSITQTTYDNQNPQIGDNRYYYVDNPQAGYTGLVQNALMIYNPKSRKTTLMARAELSRKSQAHTWMIGLHNWYYNVDKATSATYSYQYEVAPNPKGLGYQQWNGNQWQNISDQYGNRAYNGAMQYYNGKENILALIATDKWNISPTITANLGARLQWHRIDGDWYPEANRKASGTNWVSGTTAKIKKDFYAVTGTASIVWKAFQNLGTQNSPISLGFLGDVYYIQQSFGLSSYAGADDPRLKKSEIPGFSAGIYFNHPMLNIVSKITKIKRTNFTNNSTFNRTLEDGTVETQKQTITYDVSTVGWTTDILFKPFKGFQLHALLTLQNPKYENYEFEVFGQHYSNNGNIARSVSKTLIEIDPSYTFSKFKIWASARYFSKEFANYPNTLVFAGRWETFAGINYKYDKNIDFSLSAVNLLNQNGAQGTISGTNTTTAQQAEALYDKPLAGTYIRPFTIEFKTRILF